MSPRKRDDGVKLGTKDQDMARIEEEDSYSPIQVPDREKKV